MEEGQNQYGLRGHSLMLDPGEQEIYQRILFDLRNSRTWGGKTYAGGASHLLDLSRELDKDKKFNRKRGLRDYEDFLGINMYDWLFHNGARGLNYLDAGCGDGYAAEEAALFCKQLGLPVRVDALDRVYPNRKIHNIVNFRLSDISELDADRYDLISAAFVLPHSTDPLRGIEKLFNSLRSGGLLAATVFPDSVTINGMPAFGSDSVFVKKIVDSGGKFKLIERLDNPDNASAIHITRGDRPIEFDLPVRSSNQPEKGYPISVSY